MLTDHFDWLENQSKLKWQPQILVSLLRSDQMRFTELGMSIRETYPSFSDGSLTRNLAKMRAAGLVRRAPCDRSTHAWCLTPAGLREAHRIKTVLDALAEYDDSTATPSRPDTAAPGSDAAGGDARPVGHTHEDDVATG